MPKIRVRPERLRDLSQRLSQASGDLAAISRMMGAAAGSLDWEVRQQGAVQSATEAAETRGQRLAERLASMSKYLAQRSQALESADNAGESSGYAPAKGWLQQMVAAWHRSVASVKQELQLLLGLGTIIAPTALPLPVLDGLGWLRRMRPDLFRRKPPEPEAPPPEPDAPPAHPEAKPAPTPPPVDSTPAHAPAPQPTEHGPFPAKETTDTNIGAEIDAPFQNAPGHRSVDQYDLVLDQFGVDSNPRYTQRRDGTTFCNVFVRDATRAMGCEIPLMTAQNMAHWLPQQKDWREVTAEEAQQLADQGKPAVAAYAGSAAEKEGHVAMIRPHHPGDQEPVVVAQAGLDNFNYGPLRDGFGPSGKREVHFYVHD